MFKPVRLNVGAVIIGRNEGERLRACLASVLKQTPWVVYVDSGSTDFSLDLARSMGVEVISLDPGRPFSAARGRNEGFARLLSSHPGLQFVQFVDGDCILVDSWIGNAIAALEADERVAVVCGRRRELRPEASVFNRLCDVEWNKPVGKSEACEGDAMMRPQAFSRIGGFDASLIAGEEPEMCLRLRRAGWDILRIDADMTLHDVAMTRVGQWWKREARAGHAYAEGAAMYGRAHGLKRSLGICFWGAGLPLMALALAWPTRGISLPAAAALYAVLVFRAWRGTRKRADTTRDAVTYAVFCAIGKFPMFQGVMHYWFRRMAGRDSHPIEYKRAEPAAFAAPQTAD